MMKRFQIILFSILMLTLFATLSVASEENGPCSGGLGIQSTDSTADDGYITYALAFPDSSPTTSVSILDQPYTLNRCDILDRETNTTVIGQFNHDENHLAIEIDFPNRYQVLMYAKRIEEKDAETGTFSEVDRMTNDDVVYRQTYDFIYTGKNDNNTHDYSIQSSNFTWSTDDNAVNSGTFTITVDRFQYEGTLRSNPNTQGVRLEGSLSRIGESNFVFDAYWIFEENSLCIKDRATNAWVTTQSICQSIDN
jgi:hypothetical protein